MPLLQILGLLQVALASPATAAIRVNQLGYLPDAPKIAVLCALGRLELTAFAVTDGSGQVILKKPAKSAKAFGPCVSNYRLDFSSIRTAGEYHVVAAGVTSPTIRIRENA